MTAIFVLAAGNGTAIAGATIDATAFWGQVIPAWVQAVGSVAAIVISVIIANSQVRHAASQVTLAKTDAARASALLVEKALRQVQDRLIGIVIGGRPLALREHRTTELIEALRQINVGDFPPAIVVPFSTLRSELFAVNARITDIYRSEEASPERKSDRPERLKSCVATFVDAASDYNELRSVMRTQFGVEAPEFVLSDKLT